MNSASGPLLNAIRDHYSRLAIFYRLLWGEHLHHGYWESDESPVEAQVNLIRYLAGRAGIRPGMQVLDIGCGLGGSSLWLARELNCQIVGITISPVQRWMAERRAKKAGLSGLVRFEVHDANQLRFNAESFDAIWIIECSEHLTDRSEFLCRCAGLLRPGGVLGLVAWLAAEHGSPSQNSALVREVCKGMLCPSLSTLNDYLGFLEAAGFESVTGEAITRKVEQTWDLCLERVRRPWVRALLPLMDADTKRFVESFQAIRRAYAEDAMEYGVFTAAKR